MTDYFAPPIRQVAPAYAPPAPAPSRKPSPVVAAAAAVAAVVAVAAGAWWWTGQGGQPPRTLVLPDTLAGLSVAPADFGADGTFGQNASKDLDMSVAGRGYGGVRGARPGLLNLIVVGGDALDELDLAMAAGTPTRIGAVSCTQTIDLTDLKGTPASPPSEDSRKILCWRTSDELSVSVFVLATDPSYIPTAAAAVQEVWDLQG